MWRDRAATIFNCEKTPVTAARGMVVTNHPPASTAAVEMLASGGNAIDATDDRGCAERRAHGARLRVGDIAALAASIDINHAPEGRMTSPS